MRRSRRRCSSRRLRLPAERQQCRKNRRRSASGSLSAIPAKRATSGSTNATTGFAASWSGAASRRRDINNPDETERDRLLLGRDIFTGLRPDGENFWDDGLIYDSTTGKTWNFNITVLPGNDRLRLRGYWGISLFGQTRTWTRVE